MRSWESLRQEVRRLEHEVEARLNDLTKVYNSVSADGKGGIGTGVVLQSSSDEIESLLAQLSTSVDSMEACIGSTPSAVHVHRSHQDKLREYRIEFKRIQSKIRSVSERNDLLRGSMQSNRNAGDRTVESAIQAERENVTSATNAADSAVNTAWSVQEDLRRQREFFEKMMGSMDNLRGNLPSIGNLVNSIRLKRRRDVIILAGVIAFCVFMTAIWVF